VKPLSIVFERTVGKDTINAGRRQLQESMKCVRNTRKQKQKKLRCYILHFGLQELTNTFLQIVLLKGIFT
jgi:hypothetical protein